MSEHLTKFEHHYISSHHFHPTSPVIHITHVSHHTPLTCHVHYHSHHSHLTSHITHITFGWSVAFGGATFGDVGVSLLVARPAFGDVDCHFWWQAQHLVTSGMALVMAGATFGDIGMSFSWQTQHFVMLVALFVAGARVGQCWNVSSRGTRNMW